MTALIQSNLNNAKTINFVMGPPTSIIHGDKKIVVTNPATNRYKITFSKRYLAVIGGRFQATTAVNTPHAIAFDVKLVDYILNDNGKTSITLLVTNYDVSALTFASATVAHRIVGELKVVA